MADENWSEGDERAAWELAESYVDDVPTASTNPAVRGFAVQVAYDAIRAATLAERARWRAVGEAGESAAFAVGQLRHLFRLMLDGHVKNAAEAARGLLGPVIERLEPLASALAAVKERP
jgi:hypothetical protein